MAQLNTKEKCTLRDLIKIEIKSLTRDGYGEYRYVENEYFCYYQSDLDVLQQFIDNSQEGENPPPFDLSPIELGYQFWNDGYKLVEVSYLGMEHQSAVTYGNIWSNWGGDHRSWTKDYYGIIDGLLFHETAHEWWGNSITATDPAHIWLHEGTAVYSEAMYIEQELGYNVMIDFMLRKP